MADDGIVSEQVLVAGGVSKRRRGASRRSPSGQRRRAPTPEPPKDLPLDTDEEMELLQSAETSPTKPSTTVVKRISTTEKTLVTKRSHSTPGEGRQTLPATTTTTTTKVELGVNTEKPVVVKRRSTTEKAMIAKRSQSSPGEGRQALPEAELKPETTTVVRRRRRSDEDIVDEGDIIVVKKTPTIPFQKLLAESVQKSPVHSPTEAAKKVPSETLKKVPVEIVQKSPTDSMKKMPVEGGQKTPTEPVKKSPVESAPKISAETVNEAPPAVVKKSPVQEVQKVPVETLQNITAEAVEKTVESVKQKTPVEESVKQKTPVEERTPIEDTKTDDIVAKKTVEVVKTEVLEAPEFPVPNEPEEETFSVPPEEIEQELPVEVKTESEEEPVVKEGKWKPFFASIIPFLKEARIEWRKFVVQNNSHWQKIISQRNRCIGALVVMIIYCGLGGLLFRFTEGAFEAFYKCGVKRVKRDFVDSLWLGSHHLLEDEWKSQARKKLMELETQLHAAHEAGVMTYSGQRSWSFLNAVVYCLTVVTTIGYGHISPSTTTGRAVTIVYAIFGIPMFLILLADFGKLFTRGIKFIWAFVRRVYYTGSCKKVRRTVPVQEVMKGVQLVYDFATFRRPSMIPEGEIGGKAPIAHPEDIELQVPLNPPQPLSQQQLQQQQQQQQHPTSLPIDGHDPPGTPAISTFEVDDEFNLPISVAIVILLIYIFVGATIYWTWENWGFFESFYFVFISMSTIGFGDFVPQHPMYMMASIVYLVFGLALTSMCINVVQEKLSDSFRQASAKIGATIGLRVNEEDGMVTPVPPVQIELPEVHNATITKSHST